MRVGYAEVVMFFIQFVVFTNGLKKKPFLLFDKQWHLCKRAVMLSGVWHIG